MATVEHKFRTPDITQAARMLTYDPSSVTWRMFEPNTGKLRPKYVRRARIAATRRWLQTWRPRFRVNIVRVNIVLFPRTQKRLAAMELELRRERSRAIGLESRISQLEGKCG